MVWPCPFVHSVSRGLPMLGWCHLYSEGDITKLQDCVWPSVSGVDALAVGLQVTAAQREAFEIKKKKKKKKDIVFARHQPTLTIQPGREFILMKES